MRNNSHNILRKLLLVFLSAVLISIYNIQFVQAEDSDDSFSAIQSGSLSFEEFVPYANYTNYQYQGDQTYFDAQDIILEYAPDNNGVFQVTSFSGQSAIAYVYQIRESGLYELASFSDYYVVEDLRYSADAMDNVDSLILPSNLSVGSSFASGYNNEKSRTVSGLINSYFIGEQEFSNVLKLQEIAQEDVGQVIYDYYYAPVVGLIVIDRTGPDGSTQRVLQLLSAQGYRE